MPNLVIVRHGQSTWNLQDRFTGWMDVDLTERGILEAHTAGHRLKEQRFDVAFTSMLRRAQRTLNIILRNIGLEELETLESEALNERMYGDLQGHNKQEARQKYGEEQVHRWRRSYDEAPPNGESLKDTAERVLPYYESEIVPRLKQGQNVLVVAHGNSLRALVMHLEGLTPAQIVKVEIPTAEPWVYVLDKNLKVESKRVLGLVGTK